MSKLAVIFTGQGSQYADMGLDLLDLNDVSEKVQLIHQILNYNLKKILKNEGKELENTQYVQPAIVFLETTLYDLIKPYIKEISGYLGFSLGEISALYASQILTLYDTYQLTYFRSKAMQKCCENHDGAMAAVIHSDEQMVIQTCHDITDSNGLVQAVNFNTDKQTVISGERSYLEKASALLKAKGAKRVMPLAVQGAFHTPYMADAKSFLQTYVNTLTCHDVEHPLYLNTTGLPHQRSNIKHEIAKQVMSPVLFSQSINQMIKDGFTHFLEIGPKPVLSKLIQHIDSNIFTEHLTQANDLERVKGWLEIYELKK